MNSPNPDIPTSPAAQPRVWTTLDLVNWTRSYFEKKGLEQSRLEAEMLLAEVLNCARIRLYVDFEKPVSAEHLAKFRDFVKRRGERREPLQYILGHSQFLELKLAVNPDVLIPRPETEMLAVWAADQAKKIASDAPPRVLDLCTGTGCIALHITSKTPTARVLATDISPAALTLARQNAESLKLSSRISFLEGDLYAPLQSAKEQPFDLIVANPPYVAESDSATLQPEVGLHEPTIALFAPENGLAILRRIVDASASWLKPGGYLGLEFGAGQSERVLQIAEKTGYFAELHIESDSAKIPRFLHARTKK
jgi:release factor glutamine methyltransferase